VLFYRTILRAGLTSDSMGLESSAFFQREIDFPVFSARGMVLARKLQ
jgi:hypothetical protein